MKKILLAASAAGMLLAAPGHAASSATDSFNINAVVADACTMQGINDINLGDLSLDLTAGANALLINSTATQSTSNFWLSCNSPNQMHLTADPKMVNGDRHLQSGDDAGFTDKLNYTVGAVNYLNSGTQPQFSSLTGYAGTTTTRGAIHRQIQMTASVKKEDNSLRPLAGNYSATVEVTVTTL